MANYFIPCLQKGGRLHAHANTGRGAGGNNGACCKGHALGQLANSTTHSLNHKFGIAVLAQLTIYCAANIKVLLITDLISSHKAGAHGREAIQAFA